MKGVPRITQIVLGEPSDSIRHHSSSQLPPEGEAQGSTVGDRGNQPAKGYLVYLCKWNSKGVRILIFQRLSPR